MFISETICFKQLQRLQSFIGKCVGVFGQSNLRTHVQPAPVWAPLILGGDWNMNG